MCKRQFAFMCFVVLCAVDAVNVSGLVWQQLNAYSHGTYAEDFAVLGARLQALNNNISALENKGLSLPCSQDLSAQAQYLLFYSARDEDLAAAKTSLLLAEQSLAVTNQTNTTGQDPATGCWPGCFNPNYWGYYTQLLSNMLNALANLESGGERPQWPVRCLQHIGLSNNTQNITALLQALNSRSVSDVLTTGRSQRSLLNGIATTVVQLCFKYRDYINANVTGIQIGQQYVDAFVSWLHENADDLTQFWGERFAPGDVTRPPVHGADLSMTYHMISYSHGSVVDPTARWYPLLSHLLAVQAEVYPWGWRSHYPIGTLGAPQLNAHNLYDVVRICADGWNHVNSTLQSQVSTALNASLQWVLGHSVDSGGHVLRPGAYAGGVADAYYYTASFLDYAGFFDTAKRFWQRDPIPYPSAHPLCCAMKARLAGLGLQGASALGAMQRLTDACPSC